MFYTAFFSSCFLCKTAVYHAANQTFINKRGGWRMQAFPVSVKSNNSYSKSKVYSKTLLSSIDYDDVTHIHARARHHPRLWLGAQTADTDCNWLKQLKRFRAVAFCFYWNKTVLTLFNLIYFSFTSIVPTSMAHLKCDAGLGAGVLSSTNTSVLSRFVRCSVYCCMRHNSYGGFRGHVSF